MRLVVNPFKKVPFRWYLTLFVALLVQIHAFSPVTKNYRGTRSWLTTLKATDDKEPNKEVDPLTKATWYAVEAFGKIFKQEKQATSDTTSPIEFDLSCAPSSLQEAFKRIELDNKRSYFLSGEVDKMAYAEDCIFADPFVSFKGRDRFVENLANLGSFITGYDAKMIKYDVSEETTEVNSKLMVKLELNLPWKPVLAWPWGVRYKIDPVTFLITEHIESWDVTALDGVKQIFRKPTTKINRS